MAWPPSKKSPPLSPDSEYDGLCVKPGKPPR